MELLHVYYIMRRFYANQLKFCNDRITPDLRNDLEPPDQKFRQG